MTEQGKELYRRVIAAIGAGDEAALDSLLAEDLVDHNPMPGQSSGREGFKEWMRSARRSFPDLEATVEQAVAERDLVAARVTYRGTHRGVLAGIQPTHRAVTFGAFHLVRVADDRIVEWWGMADPERALRQVRDR